MGELHKGRQVNETVADVDESQRLLHEILLELKIMNVHFKEWDSMRIDKKDLFEDTEQ